MARLIARAAAIVSYCVAAVAASSGGPLWGLAMVHNSPEEPALVSLDAATGGCALAGPALSPLAATGDLAAVDSARGVLWYLGDTGALGTTMAGVSLANGSLICEQAVPVREIGFVGFGQSMNYLAATDELIMTGIVTNASTNISAHVVFRASADPARCGSPVTRVGGFVGDADYVPMLHASALDAASQRLFLGLATSSSAFAVGIVDLATGKLEKVDAEDSSDGHQLIGMKFDPTSGTLVGLASSADYTTLYQVQLAPETGKWRVRTVPTAFPVVMGNAGSVSAFDAASGTLFALLAANTTTQETRLGSVDVASATIAGGEPPVLQPVGLGLLLNLVFANEAASQAAPQAQAAPGVALAAAESYLPATDPSVVMTGRYFAEPSGEGLTFDWEAVSARFNVSRATYVKAMVRVPPGSRAKFVIDYPWSSSAESNGAKDSDGFILGDGLWADTVAAGAANATTLYAAGLDPTKAYTIRLFNDLEPMFHGAAVYGAGNSTLLGFATDGDFAPAPPQKRSLEWVGDSLTAGFGSRGSAPPCAATQATSSNYHSYSRIACDALDAACSVVAVSGKGMFANCCDTQERLPQYFMQTLGNDNVPSLPWDFSRFVPDALVINAGTNDEGKNNGTQAWSTAFEQTFIAFVMDALTVRYKRPQMPVLLVQGPSLDPRLYASLQKVLAALVAAGVDAHYVSAVVDAPADGCAGHPGQVNHVLMATAFTTAARSILGW